MNCNNYIQKLSHPINPTTMEVKPEERAQHYKREDVTKVSL